MRNVVLKSLKIEHDSIRYKAIASSGFYVVMQVVLSLVSFLASQDKNDMKNKLIVFYM